MGDGLRGFLGLLLGMAILFAIPASVAWAVSKFLSRASVKKGDPVNSLKFLPPFALMVVIFLTDPLGRVIDRYEADRANKTIAVMGNDVPDGTYFRVEESASNTAITQ